LATPAILWTCGPTFVFADSNLPRRHTFKGHFSDREDASHWTPPGPRLAAYGSIPKMQTHFLPRRSIPIFRQAYAIWSRTPVKRVLVFVHGFRGHAVETWTKFDELLPQEPGCVGLDYIFYGYDAFRSELLAIAGEFRGFLIRLLADPSEVSNPMLPIQSQRPPTPYDEVILVGHSLGAVLIREALLELQKLDVPGLQTISMILFAPAHRGAYLARLLKETLSPIPLLNLLAGGVKYASPLIDQLLPESQELVDLHNMTKRALESGGSEYLVAKQVFIAKRESVVLNLPFCQDPPPVVLDSDHISICKPRDSSSPCLGHLVNSIRPKVAGAQ
jgi:pimeloyl-ACP methyl ester carboxylesterase